MYPILWGANRVWTSLVAALVKYHLDLKIPTVSNSMMCAMAQCCLHFTSEEQKKGCLASFSDRAVIDCCIWAFKFTMIILIFFSVHFLSFFCSLISSEGQS